MELPEGSEVFELGVTPPPAALPAEPCAPPADAGDPAEREMRARALASMETFRSHPEDRWERSRLQRYGGPQSIDLDVLISSISDLFRKF